MLLRVISVRPIIAKHNFISDRPKTIRNPVNGSTLKQQDNSFTLLTTLISYNFV
jgi:hypothetical protein